MNNKHNNKNIIEISNCRIKKRQSGFVLLIVVMAMLVLSMLAIEFQQESYLQIKMSRHRQHLIQCDYALESGLAAAGKLIQQYHEEMLARIRNPQATVMPEDITQGDTTAITETTTTESESQEQARLLQELIDKLMSSPDFDPNNIDPNALELGDLLADPNQTLGDMPEEWKDHLLKQETIEVGSAKADIYIYGENYKLPLIWAIRSPFARGASDNSLTMISELLRSLEPENANTQKIVGYLQKLTDGLKVPYCPTLTYSNNRWGRSGANYTNQEINLLTVKNHILFAAVGAQWHKTANDKRHPEIQEMFKLTSGNMVSDYIGLWGGIKININTAPAEVLAAGFKGVGLTMELAEKIVQTREENGLFRSSILVREIPGLEEMYTGIYPLADVIDHVYTVRIVASSGEVSKTKSACFYRNGRKLEILAVY